MAKTYRLEVSRVVRDVQWRTVTVVADSEDDAECRAIELANNDSTFWDDVKQEPIESDEPAVDNIQDISGLLKVGDRVAFSREFLRSTGQYTGPGPFARGVVSSLGGEPGDPFVLATVTWDNPVGVSTTALTTNLVREDRIHLEPV